MRYQLWHHFECRFSSYLEIERGSLNRRMAKIKGLPGMHPTPLSLCKLSRFVQFMCACMSSYMIYALETLFLFVCLFIWKDSRKRFKSASNKAQQRRMGKQVWSCQRMVFRLCCCCCYCLLIHQTDYNALDGFHATAGGGSSGILCRGIRTPAFRRPGSWVAPRRAQGSVRPSSRNTTPWKTTLLN